MGVRLKLFSILCETKKKLWYCMGIKETKGASNGKKHSNQ